MCQQPHTAIAHALALQHWKKYQCIARLVPFRLQAGSGCLALIARLPLQVLRFFHGRSAGAGAPSHWETLHRQVRLRPPSWGLYYGC